MFVTLIALFLYNFNEILLRRFIVSELQWKLSGQSTPTLTDTLALEANARVLTNASLDTKAWIIVPQQDKAVWFSSGNHATVVVSNLQTGKHLYTSVDLDPTNQTVHVLL